MKELHLICNAHLDPVWQWDWDEGISATIATFYSAAKLAEEYDYIFCHNESLIYEYIEIYDKSLFKKIKQLVKAGKWHIMGGWYLQPDCNLPSGEGFVRQIEIGRKYFYEKFGVRPSIAINFDSFGHSQGLVQILKKCGYDGYIFCRPMKSLLPLPDIAFNWKGLDGSVIKAARGEDETIYCSGLGSAASDILRKAEPWADKDFSLVLWGVGNHGGGASRKDLQDIEALRQSKKNEYQIMHSTPEAFFDRINPDTCFEAPLQPCFVKCYTSGNRLKQKYIELENKLLLVEKINTVACLLYNSSYEHKKFDKMQKALCAIQFHDAVAGTSILKAEKSCLQRGDYGLEIADKLLYKAFFKLIENYACAEEGIYPVFVFNPNPYEVDEIIECEILVQNPIISQTEGYMVSVKEGGQDKKFQIIKEAPSINMDRRKRIAFQASLTPLNITRFDISVYKDKKQFVDKQRQTFFNNGIGLEVEFDEKSGCLDEFIFEGKSYISGNAFAPIIYDDNADPWGWNMQTVGSNYQKINAETKLRIIERGDLFTAIESIYSTGKSEIKIAYRIYNKKQYIDISVDAVWNDAGKGLKLEIPIADIDEFLGQTAFGTQKFQPEQEQCAHRFLAVEKHGKCFAIFNNCTYGCSIEKGKLYINLLNGSVYCAHPIDELPIIDQSRHNIFMETGRHSFSFRLNVCDVDDLERLAQEFNQPPYALNAYPHGKGDAIVSSILSLTDKNIVLSALRMVGNDTYMVRLFNNSKENKSCICSLLNSSISLCFGRYEVKTLILKDGCLNESEDMIY